MKYKEFDIVPAFGYKEEIKALFTEYTQMLVDNDPVFASYLELQNYDDEIENLEHKYGSPDGRLYIALLNGAAVGSVGLKKIDGESCELKRMYVRPEYRGRGLAEYLARLILNDAKEAGYKYILLDTLPFLQAAQKLYRKVGFYEIEKYNDSPMDNATYMRYDLT
mgnify:CR=1 FL=1